MNIETRAISTAAQLADLYALYASHMLECPYEYETSEDAFRDAVCQPVDSLSDQLFLVALESTQAMAFAHIGTGVADDGTDDPVGVIRSLVVPRGSRSHDVGQALLDAAHEHFSGAGLRSCYIGHWRYKYPCTRMSLVRSTWAHICSLLEENDYVTVPYFGSAQSVRMMVWRDMDLAEPTFRIAEMQVEVGGAPLFPNEPNHGSAPRVTVRVLRDGEHVGAIEAMIWHVPHWHANPQDVCVTLGFGVTKDERFCSR